MQKSPRLDLAYMMPAQAQKHVTFNEALRALDAIIQISVVDSGRTIPPAASEGDIYIPASGASGAWVGQEENLAVWQDGAWAFYIPSEGWLCWDQAAENLRVFSSGTWHNYQSSGGAGESAPHFGVNTQADATNRLAVKSDAVLLSYDDVTPGSGDLRIAANKSGEAATASLIFQSDWSARAEIGLSGGDDFSVNVSPDGSQFFDAISIDKATGHVTFKYGITVIEPSINYADNYSTGDRRSLITIAGDWNFVNGNTADLLVNGDLATTSIYSQSASQVGKAIEFTLNDPRRIGELKFYFSSDVVGSLISRIEARNNAGDTWTAVSPDISWQSETDPQSNIMTLPCNPATAFSQYRIFGVSGSGNSSAWWHEMEIGILS